MKEENTVIKNRPNKCKKWDELNRKINEEERGNGLDNERLQGNYRLEA